MSLECFYFSANKKKKGKKQTPPAFFLHLATVCMDVQLELLHVSADVYKMVFFLLLSVLFNQTIRFLKNIQL